MKIIAYYLPQYHPIDENNEWWGPGFTEWTNVGKAKKHFRDHDQPKVPKDLGYYDLRIPDVRNQQAELAKEAGVDAFCYWHYWFGNGKRLLEMPFNEVLKTGEPNLPFCLGWANESWKCKTWAENGSNKDETLMLQSYPGREDYRQHFISLLSAFHDKRYLRVNDKPIFVIYRPVDLPDASGFINYWNHLAIKEGFVNGLHFIAYANRTDEIDSFLSMGFNSVNIVRVSEYSYNKSLLMRIIIPIIKYKLLKWPLKIEYKLAMKYFTQDSEKRENIFPTIIPNWDHTPRSRKKGVVFHNSTPELFAEHVKTVLNVISAKKDDDQIVFIKSWNEWGEGNYMEPDLKYGKKYIETLGDIKKSFMRKKPSVNE